MSVHVVYTRPMQVVNGVVVNKESATIHQMANATMEMRVVPDSDVPNSANNPNIKDYVIAEDASGFNVVHMDNTIIVTSDA